MLLRRSFLRPLKALALSLPLFASTSAAVFALASSPASTLAASSSSLNTASSTDTCAPPTSSPASALLADTPTMSSTDTAAAPASPVAGPASPPELPVLFLSHCAPILLMDSSPVFGAPNNCHRDGPVADWYRNLPAQLDLVEGDRRPKAIVMLSAHWEATTAVEIAAQDTYPGLYYDYYGFPKYTYEVQYPAPGSVTVAKKIQSLLSDHGILAGLNTKRNIDHGGFIPLMHMYPEADIPVIQLSIYRNYDPASHLRIGHALASLRKEGVLLVGSGQFTHGAFDNPPKAKAPTQVFVDAMTNAIAPTEEEEAAFKARAGESSAETIDDVLSSRRGKAFINWTSYPHARLAHPPRGEDHFMPLGLVLGAARTGEEAFVVGDHWITHMHSLRTVAFGDVPRGKKNKKIVAATPE